MIQRGRREGSVVGSVQRLWWYPVKSMGGEQREYLDLDARGVVGDRVLAVRDADGKLGSGKDTRRFRRMDGLLNLRASSDDIMTRVHFPDGRVMRADDPEIHVELSQMFGRPVTLATQTDVAHLDAGAVHLVTNASLTRLAQALPSSRVDERRFRPNLVLAVPDDAAAEETWVGRVMYVGNWAALRIVERTERCGMVSLAQPDLPGDPEILRHITERAELQFGLYADVIAPGRVRSGDIVTLAN